jgi:hypothetical protein
MKMTPEEIENQRKLLKIRETLAGICRLQGVTLGEVFYSDIEVYQKPGTDLTWHTHASSEKPAWATDDNRVSYEINCKIDVKTLGE